MKQNKRLMKLRTVQLLHKNDFHMCAEVLSLVAGLAGKNGTHSEVGIGLYITEI